MADIQADEDSSATLDELLGKLSDDYAPLSARIRTAPGSVECECEGITFRVHFPAFRQGAPTVEMMIDVVTLYLTRFALPRQKILDHIKGYGKIEPTTYEIQGAKLRQEAIDTFKKAQRATNRNGEVGELILYLLSEWILGAPQILAKMPLKTNSEMPVHGSDGVHVKFDPVQGQLEFYWGESKLYASATDAIDSAMASISKALEHSSVKYELDLVERYIDLSGLDEPARAAVIQYLDPFSEASNKRVDHVTCLICFNFDGHKGLGETDNELCDAKFAELALSRVKALAPNVASEMKAKGLEGHKLEIFFLPVPSVQIVRDYFQDKIGWNSDA